MYAPYKSKQRFYGFHLQGICLHFYESNKSHHISVMANIGGLARGNLTLGISGLIERDKQP
jgi:hypothetical protein